MDVINHVVALAAVGIVTRNFFQQCKERKIMFPYHNYNEPQPDKK